MNELEWIERFVAPRRGKTDDPQLLGPGDDAALLPIPPGEVSVLTVDGFVEGRHFRDGWLDDAELAERLIAVTVSDLAAMGAIPQGLLLSFETPELPGRLGERFFEGLDRGLKRAGVLLGGNVVRSQGGFSLTATAIGSVVASEALRRDAIRVGDTLAVSGLPGRAGQARDAIADGRSPQPPLSREAWTAPPDRVPLGRALVAEGVRAAIDLSDGLLRDLKTFLEASACGATLDLEAIFAAARAEGISEANVLNGGEDYELLIAGDRAAIERAFTAAHLPPPILVGTTSKELGLRDCEGELFEDPRGWDPFRED